MRPAPLFALLMLLMSGCQQQVHTQEKPGAVSNYTEGGFSFSYPNWPEAENTEQNFLVRNNGSCVFAAARYPDVPSKMFMHLIEGQFNSSFDSGGYMDFTMSPGGTPYNATMRVIYCNYDTYSLTMACRGESPGGALFSSASCGKRNITAMPGLGMMPTPQNGSPSHIVPAIREARENGVDVLDWYFDWKGLDGNWSVADYLMEPLSYEGRSAAMVEVIHTSVLAKYPDRYKSFDDPGFADDFSDFAADFVRRYEPDYFFVGGEVDDYLYAHRDKIPAFKSLLAKTRAKVKAANPSTKFGFTVTYHDAIRNNATDIAATLAPEADVIAYTTHGYHDTFEYDNVSRGISYLEGVRDAVPGKPYAIIETGWSSSELLNSSEEKQAEFAKAYFSFVNTTDAEYVIWCGLYDPTDCTEVAESFLTDAPYLKDDEGFMAPFKEYICSLALKRSDGTPKKAWAVWQENT